MKDLSTLIVFDQSLRHSQRTGGCRQDSPAQIALPFRHLGCGVSVSRGAVGVLHQRIQTLGLRDRQFGDLLP